MRWPADGRLIRLQACVRIHSETRDFRQSLHCILMFAEQARDLLVQLADLVFDQLQVVQFQPYQPTVDRVDFGAGAQRCRAGFSLRQRLQHPSCTGTEQVGNQTGQLDMGFFQPCLQLILQTDSVPRPLTPRERVRVSVLHQSLFGIGHKAQSQFLRNQPLHQTFRVPKVFLAPASSAIGQRLRQMECSRHFPGTLPILTARFAVPFQCAPDWFSLLSSRLHHRFLDPLLDEPFRQPLQLLRVASEPASLKLVFVVDFHIRHNYCELLFVDVNSSYPITP